MTNTLDGNAPPPTRGDATSGTPSPVLLLQRSAVERLLPPDQCIAAVEEAFRLHATGKTGQPGVLGIHVDDGGFHIKAAALALEQSYFAAKLNANFPHNGARHGLPTIQGVLMLCDATNGLPLALMDSMSITALRTAAATAIAAKYLARAQCATALLCGCGSQAAAQLRGLIAVRAVGRILVYDQDADKAAAFAAQHTALLSIPVQAATDLAQAVAASTIVITCTTARRHFIEKDMVLPGTFIAAVGADNEDKQEIAPALMTSATVVTDLTVQCAAIGDLHHAISAGLMKPEGVHAQIGEIIAGLKRGRRHEDEIIVFDSTGTALQDVAAAAVVFRRARGEAGSRFAFNE